MKLRWPVARVVLILLVLVGAVRVGIGVKALVDGRRFIASAVEARGVVVDVANVREYDSDLEREVTRPVPGRRVRHRSRAGRAVPAPHGQ